MIIVITYYNMYFLIKIVALKTVIISYYKCSEKHLFYMIYKAVFLFVIISIIIIIYWLLIIYILYVSF